MKKFFSELKLVMVLLIAVFCLGGMTISANAEDIEDDVTLYYVQDYLKDYLSLPADKKTSYKIPTDNLSGTPEFKITSGWDYFTVSEDGVIKPSLRNAKYLMLHTDDLDNFMLDDDMDSPKYYCSGTGTVEVTCGDYHKEIKIRIQDYAKEYTDKFVAEKAAEVTNGITDELEKLTAIVTWVGDNTSYNTRYSRLHNIVVTGEGDCIANSILIVSMCKSVGIQAKLRRSNQDRIDIGDGHVNSIIRLSNGKYYKAEVFSLPHKPRPTELCEVNDFATQSAGDSWTIFQYDGFDEEITVPESLTAKAENGEVYTRPVKTIGKVDRFDEDAFTPIFYTKYDYDLKVRKINIPAGITTINDGALAGAPRLTEISVASSNPNYASYEGALYNKTKEELLFVPSGRTWLTIPSSIKSIRDCALCDTGEIDFYYEGTEADWNSKNISLPSKVHIYFGTNRVTGLNVNKSVLSFSSPNATAELDKMNLVSIVPSDASNLKVTFKSNDDNVCSILKNKLYVTGEGECTITATTADGGFSKQITVKVKYEGRRLTIKNGSITSVEVDGQLVEDYNGQTSVVIKPYAKVKVTRNEPKTGQRFTNWKRTIDLKDEGGLTVNDYWGTYGERDTIGFQMPDQDLYLEAEYEVPDFYRLDKILSIEPENPELKVGADICICENSKLQLSLTTYPEYAYTGDVVWKSDNEESVKVDENGLITTYVYGNATITASQAGVESRSVTIYVQDHMTDESTRKVIERGDCVSQPMVLEEYCTRCKKTVRIMYPAEGHVASIANMHYTKKPTCTEDGEIEYICEVCGIKVTEVAHSTGHNMVSVITRYATDDEPGIVTKTCKNCGYSYTEVTYEREPNTSTEENNQESTPTPVPTPSGTGGQPATQAPAPAAPTPTAQPSSEADNVKTDDSVVKTEDGKEYQVSDKLENSSLKKNLCVADKTSGGLYKITKVSGSAGKVKSGTVEYCAAINSEASSVKIPKNIKIAGATFKVTSIAAKAFKNNKKLKSITIQAEITRIGSEAFSGCSNLSKITVKSKSIKSVGKKAFKGIKAKAKFSVPKKVKKKYKKYFSKAGAPKNASY